MAVTPPHPSAPPTAVTSPMMAQIDEEAALQYFDQGLYGDLDWEGTLDFMTRRYIQPLQHVLQPEASAERALAGLTLADCGAGFGWLSFAWLKAGGEQAILIEPDARRLRAAQAIAKHLGLLPRCTFLNTRMQDAPLADYAVDVAASVECLEHVGRPSIAACINTLCRLPKQAVLLTTPNARFPIIAHDSRLPAAHWLPKSLRQRYAGWFGRAKQEEGNDFLRPADLRPLQQHFKPTTRYQTFGTFREFLAFYPHYLPYGPQAQRQRTAPSWALRTLVKVTGSLFGTGAWRWSPNLANIWLRDPPLTGSPASPRDIPAGPVNSPSNGEQAHG
ncbi:class I SAM-dependent methyltransferase [Parvibium lacunae]|uniref:Class I SAM-dependent methyltransferase n=1 Tax=Parvibium lacunae TaxID=1888893 RepID=A0A368L0T3_9BURK|nr:class I SAM-dependent methyltransferase [Parvibium lacunae]RCS57055.1 class I SAM-dependent methyltransferase [Parvibium lacunae]